MKNVLCTFVAIMVLTVSATAAEERIKTFIELGYADAAYWKVKPCKLDARSLELNQTCPLFAIPTPMALENYNPEQWFPVTLKCANTKNGTIELLVNNKENRPYFKRFTKTKKLIRLIDFVQGKGRESEFTFDLIKHTISWVVTIKMDAVQRKLGEDKEHNMDLLQQKVCFVLQ